MSSLLLHRRAVPAAVGFKNPFPGARPFKRQEYRFFFGRKHETAALGSLVRAQPLVLLYAPSGAGKSSLISAGLLHELCPPDDLRDDSMPVPVGTFDVLGVANVHPGAVRDDDGWPSASEVPNVYVRAALDSLGGGARTTHLTFDSYLASRPHPNDEFGDPVPRLIVFDQFEEILEPFDRSDWLECRDDFIRQLDTALRSDPSLHVLIGIREDHLATIERLLSKMTTTLRARYRMDRLSVPKARIVIDKATKESGVPIAGDALDALVEGLGQRRFAAMKQPSWSRRLARRLLRRPRANTARPIPDEFVDPGLLSVVGRRLWSLAVDEPQRKRTGNDALEITLDDVERSGGVDGALERYYDEAVKSVASGRAQTRVRKFFEHRLISQHGTRQLVAYDPDSKQSHRIKQTVIEQLRTKYGLLRTEYRGGVNYLELSHDGFVAPVQRANQALRRRRRKKRNVVIGGVLVAASLASLLPLLFGNGDDSTSNLPVADLRPVVQPAEMPRTPSLVGLTEDDASAAIEAAGLRADYQQVRSSAPPGQVVDQLPAPGEQATNVVLSVSAGSGVIVRDDRVLIVPGEDPYLVEVLLNDEPVDPDEPLIIASITSDGVVEATLEGDQIAVSARTAGTYEVVYTAVDAQESKTGTLVVEAVGIAARVEPSDATVVAGTSIEFADESTGVEYTRIWTFADTGETWTEPTAVHRFDQAGTFVVRLEVTDRSGRTDSESVQVTVRDGPRTVSFVAEDINLRTGPAIDASAGASLQDVTGSTVDVDPTPTNGWYRIARGEWEDLWVFGSLVVPQDGALQVGETLSGDPAILLDELGEPLMEETDDGPMPRINPSGRLVLVDGFKAERYRVLLPDGSTAHVSVAEVRILVQPTLEPSTGDPLG